MELSLPGEEESCVRDPPLSALGGGRGKVRVREPEGGRGERRRSRVAVAGVERRREEGREGRRPGVAFAPVPGFGYVQPPGY